MGKGYWENENFIDNNDDDVAMDNVELSSIKEELAERKGFTSEIFKMELNGIPKFFGVNQVWTFVSSFVFFPNYQLTRGRFFKNKS